MVKEIVQKKTVSVNAKALKKIRKEQIDKIKIAEGRKEIKTKIAAKSDEIAKISKDAVNKFKDKEMRIVVVLSHKGVITKDVLNSSDEIIDDKRFGETTEIKTVVPNSNAVSMKDVPSSRELIDVLKSKDVQIKEGLREGETKIEQTIDEIIADERFNVLKIRDEIIVEMPVETIEPIIAISKDAFSGSV